VQLNRRPAQRGGESLADPDGTRRNSLDMSRAGVPSVALRIAIAQGMAETVDQFRHGRPSSCRPGGDFQ
jgi:hypothetical protein